MTITEQAPAKINLGLKILGKRGDGFHDILSLFQTVTLFDELTLESPAVPGLTCSDPSIPTDLANLVLRAERCFNGLTDHEADVAFTLKKTIPMGAGLGGGSADAAAALRSLMRLHGMAKDESFMQMCASKLGSDIPFLLHGGTAVVSGRGERIIPVKWPFDFIYVIVNPGFGVSTSWAYANIGVPAEDDGRYKQMTDKLIAGTCTRDDFFDAVSNNFEPLVCRTYPDIQYIRSDLLNNGALTVFLTGSGASMVGVFENTAAAEIASMNLDKRSHQVFVVKKHPRV